VIARCVDETSAATVALLAGVIIGRLT